MRIYLHAFPSWYGSQWSEGSKSSKRSERSHVSHTSPLGTHTDRRYLQRTTKVQYTLCPQKTKAENFSAKYYLELMKSYKIWRTYSRVYSGHNGSFNFNKACVIPLPETFYFNDVLQNWYTKCNLYETFYQVWALRSSGGRYNHRQTRSCLLNRCAKISASNWCVMTLR